MWGGPYAFSRNVNSGGGEALPFPDKFPSTTALLSGYIVFLSPKAKLRPSGRGFAVPRRSVTRAGLKEGSLKSAVGVLGQALMSPLLLPFPSNLAHAGGGGVFQTLPSVRAEAEALPGDPCIECPDHRRGASPFAALGLLTPCACGPGDPLSPSVLCNELQCLLVEATE